MTLSEAAPEVDAGVDLAWSPGVIVDPGREGSVDELMDSLTDPNSEIFDQLPELRAELLIVRVDETIFVDVVDPSVTADNLCDLFSETSSVFQGVEFTVVDVA